MGYQLKPGVSKALKAVVIFFYVVVMLACVLILVKSYTGLERRVDVLEHQPVIVKQVVVTPTATPTPVKKAGVSVKPTVKAVPVATASGK